MSAILEMAVHVPSSRATRTVLSSVGSSFLRKPRVFANRKHLSHRGDRQLLPSCSAAPVLHPSQGSSTQSLGSADGCLSMSTTTSYDGSPKGNTDEYVYTYFRFSGDDSATKLTVSGSWNNWNKEFALVKVDSPFFVTILPLQPGGYQYKFLVDTEWKCSESDMQISNGQGGINNYRLVAPTCSFTYRSSDADKVFVVGEWDNWKFAIPLRKDPESGLFNVKAQLPDGTWKYQFIVDGQISSCETLETFSDDIRGPIHQVTATAPVVFKLFYATGWDSASIMYRITKSNGTPVTKEWQRATMLNAPSKGSVFGNWKFIDIIATSPDDKLEFVTSNDDGKEDRPYSGATYQLPIPGAFKLVRGGLRPFVRGLQPRVMLVSDIDGTMIGTGDDAYASSQRFTHYWENNPSLVGSVLVYNTGRSLGQFVELLKTCDGQVAVPDVLITAVGTKVWLLDETSGRAGASGLKWVEDTNWTRRLDKGWNLSTVQRVVGGLVNQNGDDTVHWLDKGVEHPHRCALSAHVKNLEHLQHNLVQGFKKAGLEVRIIVSGSGDWRYIDCVPSSAGKQEALEYVRSLFGISKRLCVAAGDSGNDILMLEGDHPSIVVGNAQPELMSWLNTQTQGKKIVLSDAAYADGILEGLCRHGLY